MVLISCLARGVAPEDPRRYVGLRNQGNTCHLNTVLQALYMTPDFREGLLGLPASELPQIGRALCNVFSRLSHAYRPVSTKPLTLALRPVYPGCTRQQDCHDTWLLLCDQIESNLKDTPLAKLVAQLFEGKQQDYVRCHACGTVTNTPDTFSNLSLAVPEEGAAAHRGGGGGDGEEEEAEEGDEKTAKEKESGDGGGGGGGGAGSYTVLQALREWLKPEQLRGEDQFMCDKCKGKRDAERGVRLRSMPPIISIHLKRFSVQSTTDRRGGTEFNLVKVNSAVHFSRHLDLRPFVSKEAEAEAEAEAPAAAGADGDARGADPPPPPPAAASSSTPASPGAVEMMPTGTGGAGSSGSHAGGGGAPSSSGGGGGGESLGSGSLLYDLYAVLLHMGSLEKGHYFALIKDVEDGAWHKFDDERVTRLEDAQFEAELKRAYGGKGSTSAYMLLYREVPNADAPRDGDRPEEGGAGTGGGDGGGGTGAPVSAPAADEAGEERRAQTV